MCWAEWLSIVAPEKATLYWSTPCLAYLITIHYSCRLQTTAHSVFRLGCVSSSAAHTRSLVSLHGRLGKCAPSRFTTAMMFLHSYVFLVLLGLSSGKPFAFALTPTNIITTMSWLTSTRTISPKFNAWLWRNFNVQYRQTNREDNRLRVERRLIALFF